MSLDELPDFRKFLDLADQQDLKYNNEDSLILSTGNSPYEDRSSAQEPKIKTVDRKKCKKTSS
jgi:hypothetical protein